MSKFVPIICYKIQTELFVFRKDVKITFILWKVYVCCWSKRTKKSWIDVGVVNVRWKNWIDEFKRNSLLKFLSVLFSIACLSFQIHTITNSLHNTITFYSCFVCALYNWINIEICLLVDFNINFNKSLNFTWCIYHKIVSLWKYLSVTRGTQIPNWQETSLEGSYGQYSYEKSTYLGILFWQPRLMWLYWLRVPAPSRKASTRRGVGV